LYQIGILQFIQHLDDAVHGFKQGLADQNISARFHYVNADGNKEVLPKLAAELANKEVDLIFACSTPAALSAARLPGNIPVVFTPVFDPESAGLVKSMQRPAGKATGVSGMILATDKLSFLHRLLPAAKQIGVLFHTEDANALIEVKNLRKYRENLFELVDIPIEKPEELSNLPDMLPAGLDALFLPIGKAVEDNFASIVYYTDSIGLPVVASHAPNVPAGALAALVADHYRLGIDCAQKAGQILQGLAPGDIPVDIVRKPEILLNRFAAQNLGIELPADLCREAKEIFD
jgi:ABC-type uncharacterized transport system substrate-binding protein